MNSPGHLQVEQGFLEKQSDQGLHCLQFYLHHLGALLFGRTIMIKF